MIKKLKIIWNKHDKIIVLIFLLLALVGWCTDLYITPTDELWNFMNTCKIVNGYKMYVDANIIITPLFFYIGYILLKFLGTNLLIFRIYNLVIMSVLFWIIYLVIKRLIKDKFRAFFYLICFLILGIRLSPGGANYSTFALIFVLLGLYYNLIVLEKNKVNNIIQTTIMFLVTITKQNIGAYYILGVILYQLMTNKKEIKNIIKQGVILTLEFCVLMLIFYYNGMTKEFINLTVKGISEFAYRNGSFHILDILTLLLWMSAIIGMGLFLLKKDKIPTEIKKKVSLLMCMCVPMLFIQYPIFNIYHKLLSTLMIAVFIIYVLDVCVLKLFLNKYKIIKIIPIIVSCLYCMISIGYFVQWIINVKSDNNIKSTDYYFGGFFQNDEEYENYKKILEYINKQDKRVIILSSQAALYNIPLEINNGAMDLPLLGNMGENGENEMLKSVKNLKNVQILILNKDEKLFYQESKKINDYIRQNMNYIGIIEQFEIYEQ